MTPFGFEGMFFQIMPFVFVITFILVIGTFIVTFIRGMMQWNQNNHSPRLTVDAFVTSRRIDVSCHTSANAGDVTGAHGYHSTSSSSYYVTFQVESGDRIEFLLSGREYGMLSEGDRGRLSFQGTRYLGFERR